MPFLDDTAGLGHLVEHELHGAAPGVGLIGWSAATRDELRSLDALRTRHAGPLVAVLRDAPAPVGARAVLTRLEGAVMLADVPDRLSTTVAAVAAGQLCHPPALRDLARRPGLSPRERQILAMVVLDLSNADIARRLVVTESNVKGHLSSAFRKLGVSSRNEAIELILDADAGLGTGILRITSA